jgi:S1-C subfamily serine protease
VTPGGPAEKAGIEEGNRIAAINGVSLRLPREDAGDDETTGAMQSRLQREMRKVKAGDDVTLDIWAGGRSRTVKVKTVAADDLSPARISRTKADERAAIGVSLGSTGNKRDTAGVYVSAVTDGGPAEKAGIIEGDRLAAINGVDLRVAKEDAGDAWVASARVQRLQREIAKLKPGQTADLTVISGGRSRTVKVTTIKSSELPRENGFAIQFGDGFATPPMPPMPAMAPMAPLPPMPPDLPRALETARAAVEQVRLRFGRTII